MPDFTPKAREKIKRAVQREFARGDDCGSTNRPFIPRGSGGAPTPQEEYTVYQGLGNNTGGFAMERGHPPLFGTDPADDEDEDGEEE